MAEHPNAELWRKGQEAFSRRDMDSLRTFWADDIVYHVPGAHPIAGEHKDLNGVLAFFARLADLTGGTVRIVDVHDVFANDEHVVALLRFTASRQGKQLSWDQTHIYHISEGKITEAWLVPTDQRALDEFFLA